MGFLFSLFTSKITWVILAVVGLAALIGGQQWRINHLNSVVTEQKAVIAAAQAEIASSKALIGQWKQSYDTLTVTVETQNRAIAALEAEVAKRIAKAKEAIRLAEIERKKADGLAGTIQMMEVAKDECTAMRQLIDAYVGGLR